MRILQLTAQHVPSVGGVQYYVQHLTQALGRRGHRVDVLTINTEGAQHIENTAEGTIIRCRRDAMYHRGLVSGELARRLLRNRDYDVVHVHVPFPFGLEAAVVASLLGGAPLIATHHGVGFIGEPLYQVIARSYDLFARSVSLRFVSQLVFLTRSYRDSIRLPAVTRARSVVIRTGSDPRLFHPGVDGAAVRRRYAFGDGDTVGLWVGSLSQHNRYKGVDYLLRALALEPASRLRLLIVGDGALRKALEVMAAELDVSNSVAFAGQVANEALPAFYAAADLFVLPSISGPENSPVVLFEAMASGRPIVASDIDGVREIIADSGGGLLVPPGHSAALADALATLQGDAELRGRLGAAGRAYAERHSWDQCAQEMEASYRSVRAGTRGSQNSSAASRSSSEEARRETTR